VRYDGDHRRDPFVLDELGPLFTWVPVCPEVEAGYGVPRETMRLEGDPAAPRLRTMRTRVDRTDGMAAWCRQRVAALPADLCGFVLKSGSPSCGPSRVKVWREEDGGRVERAAELFGTAGDGARAIGALGAGPPGPFDAMRAAGEGLFGDTGLEPCREEGTGLFARELAARFPGLPLIDERELHAPGAARAFAERVRRRHAGEG